MTWDERVRLEPGWVTSPEEDPWVGERIREAYGKYTVGARTGEAESMRQVAAATGTVLKQVGNALQCLVLLLLSCWKGAQRCQLLVHLAQLLVPRQVPHHLEGWCVPVLRVELRVGFIAEELTAFRPRLLQVAREITADTLAADAVPWLE